MYHLVDEALSLWELEPLKYYRPALIDLHKTLLNWF